MKWPQGIPTTEYSEEFLQGMMDRMAVSYHKYGAVADTSGRINYLKTAEAALTAYHKDKNTEHLMDAANYYMMEFMFPTVDAAHFTPTENVSESIGRRWVGDEITPTQRGNKDSVYRGGRDL